MIYQKIKPRKIELKPTIYSAAYKNKEVRVYSIDSRIFIKWYINGKPIEKAFFLTKNFFQSKIKYDYIKITLE